MARAVALFACAVCAACGAGGAPAPHELIGKKAPDFEVITLNTERGGGGLTSLALLRKGASASTVDPKIVVVSFWATWSAASQQTLPKLADLAEKYRGRVEIIGVSVDDEPTRLNDFARTYGVRYPIAWDDGRRIVRRWYVPALPAAFVLDRDLVVRAAFIGRGEGAGAGGGVEVEIENAVKRLL